MSRKKRLLAPIIQVVLVVQVVLVIQVVLATTNKAAPRPRPRTRGSEDQKDQRIQQGMRYSLAGNGNLMVFITNREIETRPAGACDTACWQDCSLAAGTARL